MSAQELIQILERIVAEYGPAIVVEARNVAGDWDWLAYDNQNAYGAPSGQCVYVSTGTNGVSTVHIEP